MIFICGGYAGIQGAVTGSFTYPNVICWKEREVHVQKVFVCVCNIRLYLPGGFANWKLVILYRI